MHKILNIIEHAKKENIENDAQWIMFNIPLKTDSVKL